MLKVHDKVFGEYEKFSKMMQEDMDQFERVLDAAKVCKLQSERKSWIARKLIDYNDTLQFMTELLIQMMNSGALVDMEKFKLPAEKIGVNFEKLRELVEPSLNEALVNLKDVLDRDSEDLTNQTIETEE